MRPNQNKVMPDQPAIIDDLAEDLYEVVAIVESRCPQYCRFKNLATYTGFFETSWQPLSGFISGNTSDLRSGHHLKIKRK